MRLRRQRLLTNLVRGVDFADTGRFRELQAERRWSVSLDFAPHPASTGCDLSNEVGHAMSINQRQYARLPLPDEDSSAELIVNRQPISCRLVEMSIGGFGVLAPKHTKVAINDLACLRTRGSDFIVRITNQEAQADGVALGLKQVEEVLRNPAVTSFFPPWLTTTFWMAAAGSVLAASFWLFGLYESLPIEIRAGQ